MMFGDVYVDYPWLLALAVVLPVLAITLLLYNARRRFQRLARLGTPHLKADAEGFVDTFYPCRLDWTEGTVEVTGPPPSVVSVGSYRFVLSELQGLVRRTDGGAFVTALPDALAGYRLAGMSGNDGVRAGLAKLGVNPLIAEAFDDGSPKAA